MAQYVNITPESLAGEEVKTKKIYEAGNSFNEKNYLNVRLASGQKSKDITIRLLPMDLTTGNPFLKVYQHNAKVPTTVSASGFKNYICIEKTDGIDDKYGHKCPFCELNRDAYTKFRNETDPIKKDKWMKISIANHAKEAYIVRCIERGKEDEGVKFWKFNARPTDNTDPHARIIDLFNKRMAEGRAVGVENNIFDLVTGRDLTITITEGNAAPTITDSSISTPLSKDVNQIAAWVNDSKKWTDVFTIKSYDYLDIISKNLTPWFDRESKSWVAKEEYDAMLAGNVNNAVAEISEAEAQFTAQAPQPRFTDNLAAPDFPNDDLPF